MNVNEKLNSRNVAELRKLAVCYGIAGRSTMKKAELIDKLIDAGVETRLAIDEITPEQQARYAEQYNDAKAKAKADADAEAGALLDAVLGEYVEPVGGEVAILRDAPGRAIATAAHHGLTYGAEITREHGKLVLRHGKLFTLKANTYEKLAKLFAMKLGFRADRIDVARGF